MKKIGLTIACLFAGGVFAAAVPASADVVPACIQPHLIDHTQVVDSKTILFHMRGGKIWQNNLPVSCSGLKLHGFVVRGQDNQICGGQGISLVETGSVCMLGKFTSYEAPAQHSAQ
jgi:hypothetical protein